MLKLSWNKALPFLLISIGSLLIGLNVACIKKENEANIARNNGLDNAKKGNSSIEAEGNGEKGKRKDREKPPSPVKIYLAQEKIQPRKLDLTVGLMGRKEVDVYSRVLGRISSTSPKEGERVKAGQLLFKVDRSDPGESYQNVDVYSPINGWVARWNLIVGNQVSPQDPVLMVIDDQVLNANIYLPLHDWEAITPNTKINFEVNDEVRPAKVLTISRAADPATGRGNVTIEINNAKRTWKAGMVGKVTLEIDPKKRIVIPAKALNITDTGAFVYSVDNNIAHKKIVKYEVVDNDRVEILSGVNSGEQLIIAGGNAVSDNSPVAIIEEKVSEKSNGKSNKP